MIKEELIEKISKYFRLNQFESEKIFDDFFSIIMYGVKDDKIADVSNFGEFKVKYDEKGKSIEFMESRALKDTGQIVTDSKIEDKVKEYTESILGNKNQQFDKTNVEPFILPSPYVSSESSVSGNKVTEESISTDDDDSKRSFSDYFSVVKEETPTSEKIETEPVEQKDEVVENVIPQSAVDLHKEIVSGEVSTDETKKFAIEDKTKPGMDKALYELLYPTQKEKFKLKMFIASILTFYSI
ncbi:MAG: HU family DNA-binding protein, partial [Ignavibacteria bacterium]